ncbi:MAG: thiamine pyrophosphate-dependent enzyme [Dehalococcoidia bacterium]|nr:thiamine pyrophosphate-dependent enzyme [Dehalococcoidia bacterium]
MMDRAEVLKAIAERRSNECVVYTMGAMHDWTRLSSSPLDFQVSKAMGYASSVGLGLALARPDKKVIVLDGDGSLLMNLGTLMSIAHESPANLIHVVLENGLYDIPGGVPLPAVDKFNLCAVARGAGLAKVFEFHDLDVFREQLPALMREPGPIFLSLHVAPGPREALKLASESVLARQMEKALKHE